MKITLAGPPDADFLNAALVRAGLPGKVKSVTSTPLTGGRTGARVLALDTGAERYVLKVLEADNWRPVAMGIADGGEGPLWLSGATRELPEGLSCPTLDFAWHEGEQAWWMLMSDIAGDIRPRGEFSFGDSRRLVQTLARLQARYWDGAGGLETLPIPDAAGPARAWAEPTAWVGLGEADEAPAWVKRFAQDFKPLRFLLPKLLEQLSSADAEFYLKLCDDWPSWHSQLDAYPQTLNHGDLRRANIALRPGDISLIDWEFACRAPGTCDLAWHFFLHFWAYPPSAAAPEDAEAQLLAAWLSALGELGVRMDADEAARALELGWVRVMAQLGFCLADADGDVAHLATAAVDRARRALGA